MALSNIKALFGKVKDVVLPSREKQIEDLSRKFLTELKGNSHFNGGLTPKELIHFKEHFGYLLYEDIKDRIQVLEKELEILRILDNTNTI